MDVDPGPESGFRSPVCKFFIYGFRFERTLPGPKPERNDTRGANMTRKLATHNTETAITNKSEVAGTSSSTVYALALRRYAYATLWRARRTSTSRPC